MAGLLNAKQLVDGSVTPNKLSERYLQVNENGEVNGDLIVNGNTNLSETATYKGSEIATHADLYDEGGINDLINDLDEKKQDNLIAGENISIDGVTISSSTKVANSDRVLTYDVAGLKANITLVVDGNQIRVEGKTDESGTPYILGEFNVLQSQIIDNVYIENGHLFITFIVDGDPGKEKVDIDLSEFIDIYEGSDYIDITGQEVSLKYDEVRDRLITDGMALTGEIPTDYVSLDSEQTISGDKDFTGSLTKNGVGIATVNDLSDHASTADRLATPRNIWGQSFDGSADVEGDIRPKVVYSSGSIYTNGKTTTQDGLEGVAMVPGGVEITGGKPRIDFHFNYSTDDYTTRIIEEEEGVLNIIAENGLTINSVAVATLEDIPAQKEESDPVFIEWKEGNTISIGKYSSVNTDKYGPIAIGSEAKGTAEYSLAIGVAAKSTDYAGTAIGHSANASGQSTIAIGSSAAASNNHAIAIGSSSKTSVANAISIGYKANAQTTGSISIGRESEAKASDSVAIGYQSTATAQQTVSFGNSEIKRRIVNIADGQTDTEAATVGQLNILKSEIPSTLPNPNAITFTGAISGTYDGSSPLTIDIPQGGMSSDGFVDTSSDQVIGGMKIFSEGIGVGNFNLETGVGNGILMGLENNATHIVQFRNTSSPFIGAIQFYEDNSGAGITGLQGGIISVNSNEFLYNGKQIATIDDINANVTGVTINTDQTIIGEKIFSKGILTGTPSSIESTGKGIAIGYNDGTGGEKGVIITDNDDASIFLLDDEGRTQIAGTGGVWTNGFIVWDGSNENNGMMYQSIWGGQPLILFGREEGQQQAEFGLNSNGNLELNITAGGGQVTIGNKRILTENDLSSLHAASTSLSVMLPEIISNPFNVVLGEITDLRYTNIDSQTGTLNISGGVDGKRYQYSINNEAEHDLKLTLPNGKEWMIAAGEVGILEIYYLFDKYICRII